MWGVVQKADTFSSSVGTTTRDTSHGTRVEKEAGKPRYTGPGPDDKSIKTEGQDRAISFEYSFLVVLPLVSFKKTDTLIGFACTSHKCLFDTFQVFPIRYVAATPEVVQWQREISCVCLGFETSSSVRIILSVPTFRSTHFQRLLVS